MKNLLLILGLMGAIVGSRASYAAEVAVVDTQKVLNESIIGKAARSNLEGRIKKAQAKLVQLKGDFEKQRDDLAKQSNILHGSALDAKKEALQKKQVEIQRVAQDAQEELARANEQEISKVVAQIGEVVQEVAKERNFTFVFEKDKQTVLYASDRIDISADVVKILDKKKVAL
jgi:outer membrane protein